MIIKIIPPPIGLFFSTILICTVAISFFSTPAHANELRGVIRNNQGVLDFMDKRPAEAFDKFSDALADVPFSGAVHFNIGTTFLVNKEFDKALNEYRQAAELSKGASASEKEVRFRSLFNSGVALTEQKKIDEALAAYQAALSVNPESREAKLNIELLTQMSQGGGEGEDQNQQNQSQGDKKQNKDGQGQDDKDKQKQSQQAQQPKPTPKPFNSEQISKQDVGKILEELKRQEEQIRARMQDQGAKNASPGKDW